MEYKVELLRLGKKQLDLVKEINSRNLGYKCNIVEMSNAVNGAPRPKFDKIRADAETIINEWKAAST